MPTYLSHDELEVVKKLYKKMHTWLNMKKSYYAQLWTEANFTENLHLERCLEHEETSFQLNP